MCHPPGSDVKNKPGMYVVKYHAAGKRLPNGAKNTGFTFFTPPKRESHQTLRRKIQQLSLLFQVKKLKNFKV